MLNIKKFLIGLGLVPKTTSESDTLGELEVLSTDNKLRFHNGTTASPVVTEAHTATLTVKTIDADNNTISNLEVDNLKAGVLNTSATLAGATDTQVPSALAVKTVTDAISADIIDDVEGPASSTDNAITRFDGVTGKLIQNSSVTIDDSGVVERSAGLTLYAPAGDLTFTPVSTGKSEFNYSVKQNNSLLRPAQVDATAGANVSITVGDKSTIRLTAATSVDTLIPYSSSDGQIVTLINGTASPITINNETGAVVGGRIVTGTGAAVVVVSGGSVSLIYSSSVSRWSISNNSTALNDHLADTVGAHAASAISNSPSGNLAATEVQAALNELQTDIDTINTDVADDVEGPASSTDNAIARYDGVTGKLIQDSSATISDTGLLTASEIQVDSTNINGSIISNTVGGATINIASGGANHIFTSTDKSTVLGAIVNSAGTNATAGANATITAGSNKNIQLTGALTSIDMIVPTTGAFVVGQEVTLINKTGSAITINNETGATAENRILTGTGGNIILPDDSAMDFIWSVDRWSVGGIHAASAMSFTPAGTIAATDVQAAVEEVATDAASALSTHEADTTSVHGIADTSLLVTTTGAQTLTNKTLTAPVLNSPSIVTPSRSDVKQDTLANLTTYAATASNGQIVFSTDTEEMYQVVDNALVAIGGGGGASVPDVFVQLMGDEDIVDWSTGDNATFLGGGTLAGTFDYDTATPLNGTQSYKYTQAASSLDDYIASAVQEVPIRFRGNMATCYFPYTYDGGSSDIEPVIWDVTNGAKLTTSTNLLPSTGTNTSIYKVNVSIPATCTQIRFGFHVKILNSGKILAFDDVQISSDTTKYADPSTVTEWQSYTPTLAGFGTTTNQEFYYRRVGDTLEVEGVWTNGTVSGVTAAIPFPAGLTAIATTQTVHNAGSLQNSNSTSDNRMNLFVSSGGTSFGVSRDGTMTPALGNTFNNSESNKIRGWARIAGWSASNPTIITASESFSTDTASLVYASSATYTLSTLANAPVGTFITYTYAINSNTKTQTTTAPTQTTSSMNTNGIQLFSRAYNAASTAGNPVAIAIQIGKGFKGTALQAYSAVSKSGGLDFNGSNKFINSGATNEAGTSVSYDATTGILALDAGLRYSSGNIAGYVTYDSPSNTAAANAYIVINASKSPALVGVPQVQPRIAYIKDVKANTTQGGTFTSGAWQTRTLNTLTDDTGIVTSLASNQFTLPAGTYGIDASAPGYIVNGHMIKLRNITDSTDSILGSASYAWASGGSSTPSTLSGTVTITSAKTFELQHRCMTTKASDGFGNAMSFGVDEIFAVVKITKIK